MLLTAEPSLLPTTEFLIADVLLFVLSLLMDTWNVWEQCSAINKQRLISNFPHSEVEETLPEGSRRPLGRTMAAGKGHPKQAWLNTGRRSPGSRDQE